MGHLAKLNNKGFYDFLERGSGKAELLVDIENKVDNRDVRDI